MMKTKPNSPPDSISDCRSGKQRDGFTFVDLLAILAVVALLMVLEVSAYAGAKGRTKVAMCASNLRQLTLALHLYADDNNNKLPILAGIANWVWDVPWNAGNTLLPYNLQTKTFYCPGTAPRFTDEDNLALWNFYPGMLHVVGYALALSGSASRLVVSNQNTTILAEPMKIGTSLGGPTLPQPPNSERVLVADATISYEIPAPGTTTYSQRLSYDYTYVYGGFYKPHLSPHLNGNIPQGGNLGFKDGHVAWRKFEDMDQRAISGPGFWW